MEKAVYIIPGYRHLPTHQAYRQIAKMLKNQGYLPVPVTIPWQQTTIAENTAYFLHELKKKRLGKKIGKQYLLGFSYGAMIAFITSTKVKTDGLILCSLSPYFEEDLQKEQNPHDQDFVNLKCLSLAKRIKAQKIFMLYGGKEDQSLKNRVREAFGEILNHHKYLLPIARAEHNIGDKRYLNKIHEVIQQLN